MRRDEEGDRRIAEGDQHGSQRVRLERLDWTARIGIRPAFSSSVVEVREPAPESRIGQFRRGDFGDREIRSERDAAALEERRYIGGGQVQQEPAHPHRLGEPAASEKRQGVRRLGIRTRLQRLGASDPRLTIDEIDQLTAEPLPTMCRTDDDVEAKPPPVDPPERCIARDVSRRCPKRDPALRLFSG
jgi:hypothetical protein